MLSKEQKLAIVKEFGSSEKNSGDVSVQIAILTKEIELLAQHFEKNKKDLHSKRGFIAKIERRKTLLSYLRTTNFSKYQDLIAKLGIRK